MTQEHPDTEKFDYNMEGIYSHFDDIIISDASYEPTFQLASANGIVMEKMNHSFFEDIFSRLNEGEGFTFL